MERRRDKQPNKPRQAQQGQNRTRQPQQAQGGAGQQGGPSGTRQQQQFDQGSRQPSGSGVEGRFADQIREHMEVIGPDGSHVGTVDHVEGDRIKLTRAGSGTGEHSYLPCSLVAGIEGNRIRLRERGDNDFGMEADR